MPTGQWFQPARVLGALLHPGAVFALAVALFLDLAAPAVLALLPARAGLATLAAPALALAAWGAGAWMVARHGLALVARSATGYLNPRDYPPEPARVDRLHALHLSGLALGLPLLVMLASASLLPALAGLALLVLPAAWVPAAAMVLVRPGGLGAAYDLRRCLGRARRIGRDYLLVVLALLPAWAFMLGAALVLHPPGGAAFAALAWAAWTLAADAALVLFCAVLGRAMYAHAGLLNIDRVGPGEGRHRRATPMVRHLRRSREALIEGLASDGELREAIALLEGDLGERPRDISLHARLHALLRREGSAPRIEGHAQRYLGLLLAAGQGRAALELVASVRALNPQFVPGDALHANGLARCALLEGDLATAELALRGFAQRFAGHPAGAEACLLAGRVRLVQGHEGPARELFERALAQSEPGAVRDEARQYLARF
jgi:hypothetical protein